MVYHLNIKQDPSNPCALNPQTFGKKQRRTPTEGLEILELQQKNLLLAKHMSYLDLPLIPPCHDLSYSCCPPLLALLTVGLLKKDIPYSMNKGLFNCSNEQPFIQRISDMTKCSKCLQGHVFPFNQSFPGHLDNDY